MDLYTPGALTHFPTATYSTWVNFSRLFNVAVLSFCLGLTLASVVRLQLLILLSFRAVLGHFVSLVFAACDLLEKAAR